jgi:hypothetical protein
VHAVRGHPRAPAQRRRPRGGSLRARGHTLPTDTRLGHVDTCKGTPFGRTSSYRSSWPDATVTPNTRPAGPTCSRLRPTRFRRAQRAPGAPASRPARPTPPARAHPRHVRAQLAPTSRSGDLHTQYSAPRGNSITLKNVHKLTRRRDARFTLPPAHWPGTQGRRFDLPPAVVVEEKVSPEGMSLSQPPAVVVVVDASTEGPGAPGRGDWGRQRSALGEPP